MQFNPLPGINGLNGYVNQSFELQFQQTTQNMYFADGLVSFIYLKKGRCRVTHKGNVFEYIAPAFMVGIYSSPQIVHADPDTVVVGCTIVPDLLPSLSFMNKEIIVNCQNKFVTLDDQHTGFQRLAHMLMQEESSAKCQSLIQHFLCQQRQDCTQKLFGQVLQTLRTANGSTIRENMPCEWSDRTIQHIFKETYGISPKQFTAINRFRHSTRLMEANPDRSLHEIAYAARFYDQSHFIREFRKYSLLTPREFHRRKVGMAKYFLE